MAPAAGGGVCCMAAAGRSPVTAPAPPSAQACNCSCWEPTILSSHPWQLDCTEVGWQLQGCITRTPQVVACSGQAVARQLSRPCPRPAVVSAGGWERQCYLIRKGWGWPTCGRWGRGGSKWGTPRSRGGQHMCTAPPPPPRTACEITARRPQQHQWRVAMRWWCATAGAAVC